MPLSKRVLFEGIGRSDFVLGWGLTQQFVSWVAWEGEVWLFLNVGRWDFFNFPKNYFFGGVGWVVGKRGGSIFFYFFLNEFFFLNKIFYKN